MSKHFALLRMAALLLVLVACTPASGKVPDKVNLVVHITAQGDTALVIGAWAGSEVGTFPILHYETRLTQRDTAVVAADSARPTARIDTLAVALPAFGDTLEGLRFEVQALDTLRNQSGWGRSAMFFLARPFLAPGIPDSVRIDTTIVTAMVDRIRIEPHDQRVHQGFGSFVLTATYYSGADAVACTTALFSEGTEGITLIPGGICEAPLTPVDTLILTNGDRVTPSEAAASIQWSLHGPPVAPPPSGRSSSDR